MVKVGAVPSTTTCILTTPKTASARWKATRQRLRPDAVGRLRRAVDGLLAHEQRPAHQRLCRASVGVAKTWAMRTQNFDTLTSNAPKPGTVDGPRSRLGVPVLQARRERVLVLMPAFVLRVGSVLWSGSCSASLAVVGHARARGAGGHSQGRPRRVLARQGAPFMWFHVSSLGELEQAIPVMQAHRAAPRQDVAC